MSSLKGKDVLIVDDSPDVRLLTKKILEGDGARVMAADGVDAGLEFVKKQAPQLIVLDLEMPGKTGYDFLVIRKSDAALMKVPVIILSGKNDRPSVVKAIELGANDFVVKPFRASLLLQKVRKALRLTSFLSRKFQGGEQPVAHFALSVQILKISEGGCQIESSVKLGEGDDVRLKGEMLEKMDVQDLLMKVAPSSEEKFSRSGRYFNEISFIGMNEERAKKIRARLKELK